MSDLNTIPQITYLTFHTNPTDTIMLEFSELSIKNLETLARISEHEARKAWLKRVHEIAAPLPTQDRNNLLIQAAQNIPDLTADRNAYLSSDIGIRTILTMANPKMATLWDQISKIESNSEPLLNAWRTCLGIKEEAPTDPLAVDDPQMMLPLNPS